ncbi:5-hydroxyisourate hydrolase [Paenibacillus sp. 598K]|uniref:hydroxyisourate hydrolase n=1 Tax=Paenibacillus sp. 598K TaxID=1117987 RepID=UPI000FFAD5FF|nr:hydroxyisourate hydrolase [Paenibacillus sp. 598K]GBF72212.1 5-hydroxyisourate hydrolase [Paenibacillus sp. 598K]
MSGRLTTHVLDLRRGGPAAGLAIELYHLPDSGGLRYVCGATTNRDGRLDEPLLAGGELFAGTFELVYLVGAYYRSQDDAAAASSLWESVPVRFTIAEPDDAYHLPLLIAPGGYSAYRGS